MRSDNCMTTNSPSCTYADHSTSMPETERSSMDQPPQQTRVSEPAPSGAFGSLDRISRDQEFELAHAWREHGDILARNRLIEGNVRLVLSIARSLANKGIPLEELAAEGNVGLIRAAERFDPSCGCRFGTFAFRHVRFAMTALFAARSPRGRLKHGSRRLVLTWSNAVATLTTASGVAPDDEQVAEHLGWTLKQVGVAKHLHEMTSQRAQDRALQDELANREVEPPDSIAELKEVDRNVLRGQVNSLLSVLTPRERQAIELLYGLAVAQRVDAKNAASIMGCSTQDVLRLKAVAHAKLRRHRHLAGVDRP